MKFLQEFISDSLKLTLLLFTGIYLNHHLDSALKEALALISFASLKEPSNRFPQLLTTSSCPTPCLNVHFEYEYVDPQEGLKHI